MKPFDWEANKARMCDSTGRKLTVGLFEELTDNPATAVFKLSAWRDVYVRVADPTDYRAAMELLGNWDHWLALCASRPFMAHLEQWRKEVEVKLRSEAIKELVGQSKGAKGTMAAKWLAENGWAPRDMRKKKDRNEEQEVQGRVRGDAVRLGIVPGGRS